MSFNPSYTNQFEKDLKLCKKRKKNMNKMNGLARLSASQKIVQVCLYRIVTLVKFLRPLILLLLVVASDSYAGFRPKALKAEKECELWVGIANGNDPTVQIELSLCATRNGEMNGLLQWSSSRSGWSKRAVSGAKDSANSSLILHDVKILENKPNQGWRFCLIDEYNFTYSDYNLTGHYISKACKDKANLSLSLRSKN